MTTPALYTVTDKQTGRIMGTYGTLRAAHWRADRLDLAYGAVRYVVRRVEAVTPHAAATLSAGAL